MKGSPAQKRTLLSAPFVACGMLLLIAAVGLQPVIGGLIGTYSKQPIDPRRPLQEFDASRIRGFRLVPDGGFFKEGLRVTPLDKIGTENVIRLVFEPVEGGGENARERDLMLFVTYYNDPRDQVPHTPEVCYRQGGALVRSLETVEVPVQGLEQIKARLLDLTPVVKSPQGAATDESWRQAVLYVFVCNGDDYYDREQVRWAIGKPGDRSVYFSKIEVVSNCPAGQSFEETVDRCLRLFAEALPVRAIEDGVHVADEEQGVVTPLFGDRLDSDKAG